MLEPSQLTADSGGKPSSAALPSEQVFPAQGRAPEPERELTRKAAWILGSRPEELQLLCQRGDIAKPGSDALAQGLCGRGREPTAQLHLSRCGPCGGVSHLCWNLIRFLTSPQGRVQGK